jgi:hypothetical protein
MTRRRIQTPRDEEGESQGGELVAPPKTDEESRQEFEIDKARISQLPQNES